MKQNSGWNLVTFWEMIWYNLRDLVDPPHGGTGIQKGEGSWIKAVEEERPSNEFIKSRVQTCFDKFKCCEERLYVDDLQDILNDIENLLHIL